MTWQPVTYDPELNLIYVTTGNPQPVIAYKNREGANLFTASIVALNADTGKMVWYFQSSPHDTHDWDATQTAVLFDDVINGQPRKLLAQASRNGKFFVLDRTHGRAIVSQSTSRRTGRSAPTKGAADPESREASADCRGAGDAEPGRRHELVFAGLQPADRPLLRQRQSRVQRLVHRRSQRQPDGMGGNQTWRVFGAGPTEGHRLQDGQIRWSIPRYGGNSGLLSTAGNVFRVGR